MRFRAKWVPVRVKKTRQNKKLVAGDANKDQAKIRQRQIQNVEHRETSFCS
jgi:hypothetical protein